MLARLFSLQWKSFTRSASFGKSLGIKIFMGFMMLYLLAGLVFMGYFLHAFVQKLLPTEDPFWVVCQYLGYYFFFELVFRYLMQKLPVLDIKPLLVQNIKKSKIVHFILARSFMSGYNLFAFAIFAPFAMALLNNGYSFQGSMAWLIGVLLISLSLNYLNFLINKVKWILLACLGLAILIFILDYFFGISVAQSLAPLFYAFYGNPLTVAVPLLVLFGLYALNFSQLKKTLFLDATLDSKKSAVNTSDLYWTGRFGEMAPFLRLDLRLIWRNKRTKSQVWISLLIIFYGYYLLTNDAFGSTTFTYIFIGIFTTGIFLMNFGQFIPAWDSAYFSLMMSQNIPMKKYLMSKALLMTVSTVVMAILAIPYVYFGWELLAVIMASAIYNIGVNIPMVLYFGSFNKKRIELDQSPFANMQGISAIQFIMMIPLLVVPIVLFTILNYFISFLVAIAVLLLLGILGIVFKDTLFDYICTAYLKKKHIMIAGFKQKNS